jgi:hypothetical protein
MCRKLWRCFGCECGWQGGGCRRRTETETKTKTVIDPPTRSQPPNPQPTSQAPTTTLTQLQIQEQADKLLAHASEIGLSVLSRADAFWKEGKERARGIYEGQGQGARGTGVGEGG